MKVYPVVWPIDQQIPQLVKVFVVPRAAVRSDTETLVANARPLRALMSYVFDAGIRLPALVGDLGVEPEALDLMLDSGAFSVWTAGTEIDLDDYARWATAYVAQVPTARVVNLDVIPGEPTRRPTSAERDAAVEGSLRNADRLREAGLSLVEVYHWHEPIEALDEIIRRRRPDEIIGFGGLAGPGNLADKRAFLDGCFAHLRDLGGWDKLVPVHGFGISPESPLAGRYPWYSIDSSSWLKSVRFSQGVDRSGRRSGDDVRMNVGTHGEGGRKVSALYLQRVLQGWSRLEESYTALWAERGINYDLQEGGGNDGAEGEH